MTHHHQSTTSIFLVTKKNCFSIMVSCIYRHRPNTGNVINEPFKKKQNQWTAVHTQPKQKNLTIILKVTLFNIKKSVFVTYFCCWLPGDTYHHHYQLFSYLSDWCLVQKQNYFFPVFGSVFFLFAPSLPPLSNDCCYKLAFIKSLCCCCCCFYR